MALSDDLDDLRDQLDSRPPMVKYGDKPGLTIPNPDMNNNLDTVVVGGDVAIEAARIAITAGEDAFASRQAAEQSATQAADAATTAVDAKDTATAAKNAAVIAKNEAVQANSDAQDAKGVTIVARDEVIAAKDILVPAIDETLEARDQAVAASTTAVGAADTATIKAGEASQSAIEAEYWAGQSGEVTSVQGKKGVVDLERTDFPWMGSAAERNVGTGAEDLMEVGAFGLGAKNSPFFSASNKNEPKVTGFYGAGAHDLTPFPDTVNILSMAGFGNSYQAQIAVQLTQPRVFVRVSNIDGVFGNETELHSTLNLPQATQAELNAGTQTAPRLFSPKQLSGFGDSFVKTYSNELLVTTSQTIARPTDGPMFIFMCGAGGGSRGSGRAGGGAAYAYIYIPFGKVMPENMEIIVAGTPIGEQDGGSTSLWGFECGGGAAGRGSVGGGGAPAPFIKHGIYIFNAFAGEAASGTSGGVIPEHCSLFPSVYEYGGGGDNTSPYRAPGPGIVAIYY